MMNRMFGGIGVMALAFTLAVVGMNAFANQAQAAEMKADPKLQECAKACSDCQRACEAFPDDKHCKACAEECRKCEKACKAIAR